MLQTAAYSAGDKTDNQLAYKGLLNAAANQMMVGTHVGHAIAGAQSYNMSQLTRN